MNEEQEIIVNEICQLLVEKKYAIEYAIGSKEGWIKYGRGGYYKYVIKPEANETAFIEVIKDIILIAVQSKRGN